MRPEIKVGDGVRYQAIVREWIVRQLSFLAGRQFEWELSLVDIRLRGDSYSIHLTAMIGQRHLHIRKQGDNVQHLFNWCLAELWRLFAIYR